MPDTTSAGFFEDKYRTEGDPWHFSSSTYESARYAAILEHLHHRRFRLALEPGCSVGVLTLQLAQFADQVEAFDFAPSAVAAAQHRCAACSHVRVQVASLQDVTPDPQTDLLLLSEVGYYFPRDILQAELQRYVAHLAPGALLLACHWLGTSSDHILHGDEVHNTIHGIEQLRPIEGSRTRDFRIDVWSKAGAEA